MTRLAWSVRQRMLAIAVAATLVAWLLGGVAGVMAARHANEELRAARLAELARTIGAFAEHELLEITQGRTDGQLLDDVHVEPASTLDRRYQYQIWTNDGRLLLRSQGAPAAAALAATPQWGLGAGLLDGRRTLTFVHPLSSAGLQVQVADTAQQDDTLALVFAPGYLATAGLSLLAMAALAAWLVMRAMRPLQAAERELRARGALDLTPLDLHDAPRELAPLLDAFNQLLQRAASRLSQESGFTALAAHELRTPLAALRMQAQVAAREGDEARRAHQLAALVASVDRCDHLFDQLLTLAQIEHSAPAQERAALELASLCEGVLAELAPRIAERRLDVQLELQTPRLQGQRLGIEMLLRNLLANAVLYTPPGGRVLLRSHDSNGHVVLGVEDSGPGIAPADRALAFDRFVRLAPAGTPGVGLGLAIVRSVADAHGASIELKDSALGGLCVQLSFPALPGRGDNPAHAR